MQTDSTKWFAIRTLVKKRDIRDVMCPDTINYVPMIKKELQLRMLVYYSRFNKFYVHIFILRSDAFGGKRMAPFREVGELVKHWVKASLCWLPIAWQ